MEAGTGGRSATPLVGSSEAGAETQSRVLPVSSLDGGRLLQKRQESVRGGPPLGEGTQGNVGVQPMYKAGIIVRGSPVL